MKIRLDSDKLLALDVLSDAEEIVKR